MFEELRLLSQSDNSLELHTRKHRRIVNEITPAPPSRELELYAALVRKHNGWELRKAPAGGYNCAGMVWASRRTGIFDDLDKQACDILKDDGYRLLAGGEAVKCGDLALYWESVSPRNNLYHVGVVMELRPTLFMTGGQVSSQTPMILSKFNSSSGEALHRDRDIFFFEGATYSIEYWTDRP
jgi:hypothetical protein